MDLADTMRAVVTRGHGGLDQLDLTEVPTPRPAPGWVVVDVSACGLNNTDIWTREGRYGTDRDPDAVTSTRRKPGRFPIIQGADVVGHIAAVGDGVASARIGERVLCNFVLYEGDPLGRDISGSLGATHDGGYAEYVALPADNAYPVDDLVLADEELATFPCACITAEHMLDAVGLAAGESVLVTGASGGAGSALVRIRPLLAKSFPMSEIHAAQEMFMSKAFFGNIVVRPKE